MCPNSFGTQQTPHPLDISPKIKTILMDFNNMKPLKVIQIVWQGPQPPPLLNFAHIELHKKVIKKYLGKG